MAADDRSLYFAYGSNMARQVMEAKCPDARRVGTARLPGHRFAFSRRSARTGTGVANVVADESHVVWGVVWSVTAACLEALDRKEGYPWAYDRRELDVELEEGGSRRALTYVVAEPERDEVAPSASYIAGIAAAAAEAALPADYVASLSALAAREATSR